MHTSTIMIRTLCSGKTDPTWTSGLYTPSRRSSDRATKYAGDGVLSLWVDVFSSLLYIFILLVFFGYRLLLWNPNVISIWKSLFISSVLSAYKFQYKSLTIFTASALLLCLNSKFLLINHVLNISLWSLVCSQSLASCSCSYFIL